MRSTMKDLYRPTAVWSLSATPSHLMNSALHASVGDHAEDARLEPSIKGRRRLVSVNRSGTCHDTVVGASLLQVQPHLQHLNGDTGEGRLCILFFKDIPSNLFKNSIFSNNEKLQRITLFWK